MNIIGTMPYEHQDAPHEHNRTHPMNIISSENDLLFSMADLVLVVVVVVLVVVVGVVVVVVVVI